MVQGVVAGKPAHAQLLHSGKLPGVGDVVGQVGTGQRQQLMQLRQFARRIDGQRARVDLRCRHGTGARPVQDDAVAGVAPLLAFFLDLFVVGEVGRQTENGALRCQLRQHGLVHAMRIGQGNDAVERRQESIRIGSGQGRQQRRCRSLRTMQGDSDPLVMSIGNCL